MERSSDIAESESKISNSIEKIKDFSCPQNFLTQETHYSRDQTILKPHNEVDPEHYKYYLLPSEPKSIEFDSLWKRFKPSLEDMFLNWGQENQVRMIYVDNDEYYDYENTQFDEFQTFIQENVEFEDVQENYEKRTIMRILLECKRDYK